jgi:dihydrofolate synthase/folylpolyglutamate synthase
MNHKIAPPISINRHPLSSNPPDARYYFAKANIPRGLEADLLHQQAAAYSLHGQAYRSVRIALAAARRVARPDDLILVIGSIFVVGEVL